MKSGWQSMILCDDRYHSGWKKPGNKVLFFILYVLFSLPGCFELFGFASQVFSGFLTCLWTLGSKGMYHWKGLLRWQLSQVLVVVIRCWLTQQARVTQQGKELTLQWKIGREGWDKRRKWLSWMKRWNLSWTELEKKANTDYSVRKDGPFIKW